MCSPTPAILEGIVGRAVRGSGKLKDATQARPSGNFVSNRSDDASVFFVPKWRNGREYIF